MNIFTKKLYLVTLAGLAGGLSEIFWIGMYSTVTNSSGLEVARQITASLVPAWADLSIAPVLGITIHLALSVMLAFLCCTALIEPLFRHLGRAWILHGSMALLACVWAINFFIILPVINPAFVTLLPFLVTLASKMLFGWTMGSVLAKGYGDTASHSVN